MAERQSDQRLAQELNPETETGLLGPAFISASELAYRQKIRQEAQAQPNNNPPIVQQLAQAAMLPQVSMQNEMPVPAAPMPQQQMPQQQMSPQGYAMGGLIKMANGGMPDTFANPFMNLVEGEPYKAFANYPFSYDGTGKIKSFEDDAEEQEVINKLREDKKIKKYKDKIGSEQKELAGNVGSKILYGAGDAQALTRYSKGENPDEFLYGRGRFDSALKRAGLPPDATPDMVSAYISGTPSSAFQTAIPSTAISGINYGGIDNSLITPVNTNQIANINNKSDDSDGVLTTDFKVNIPSIINKPTGMHADIAKQSIDTGYMNMNPDYQPPSSIQQTPSTGAGKAATQDANIAALSDYEKLIEQSIARMTDDKGRMQNKWLRIAAGAFNAAQKGSPTFLGGLADLGAGVTEELIALNKEEQKQAQELFALYTAREKLRRESLVSQRDLDADAKTNSPYGPPFVPIAFVGALAVV